MFCDLSRYVNQSDGSHQNANSGELIKKDTMSGEDYDGCYNGVKRVGLGGILKGNPDVAMTTKGDLVDPTKLAFSVMQWCPWYLKLVRKPSLT